MIGRPRDWLASNQHSLSLAMAEMRAVLARHGDRLLQPQVPADAAPPVVSELLYARTPVPRVTSPALSKLAAAFNLTPFERDIVLLCAGMELDAGFAADCARAQGGGTSFPTFGLALAALGDAHWSALLPDGALRHWHLVDFAPGGSPSAPLTSRPLRIDERILHYLTGLTYLDERLAVVSSAVPMGEELVPSHRTIAEQMTTAWTQVESRSPALALYGPDPHSARAIAAAACVPIGWRLHAMSERLIPSAGSDLRLMVRLWEREFRLESAVVLVEADDSASGSHAGLHEFIDRVSAPVVLVGRERLYAGVRPIAKFDVAKPTAAEQHAVWVNALPDTSLPPAGELHALTAQFSLSASEIRSAAAIARTQAHAIAGARVLWAVCRQQSRGRLEDLAHRIVPAARLEDLVLPNPQKEVLEDIVSHVRHRSTVYDAWGFGAASSRGLGVTALFAGASGTGKTMAAEVIAGALDLDLYRIDLSCVVSKYIGETEKNLRSVFDAADAGGVILLFDEADALFGKRTEVKDSHDRYSNVEVSYLLQRMECYRGLAILTTNIKSALDSAFMRRIRFIVQFPFPDAEQRTEIWRRVFPRETPTRGLDVRRLAQLSVAGGSIRNVAVKAAFLAAAADEPVDMSHLLRAARGEYAKLEKSLTDAEVSGWV